MIPSLLAPRPRPRPRIRPYASRAIAFAATVAAFVGACSDSSTQPGTKGITFVAGDGVSDTVGALLQQALVVEVRDQDGRPAPGQVVRFAAVSRSSFGEFELLVGRLDGRQASQFAVDTTDARGRAAVVVQLGRYVGPARLVVGVPELALLDTARYTVAPGQAAGLVIGVADTTLAVGASYSLSALAVDRYGNAAAAQNLTYAAVDAAATVTSSGTVTGAAVGPGRIAVRAGTIVDTARVAVVPPGTLAVLMSTSQGTGVGTVSLDGTSRILLTQISSSVVMPSWNPAGDRIAFYEGNPYGDSRMFVVDMAGSRSRLIASPPDSLAAESFPRFSRDGQWVYFTGVTRNQYNYSVWRVRADGTGAERLAAAASFDYAWPDPSPDGRHVAFYAAGGISTYDLQTGAITPSGAGGVFPRYSPDGSQILFLSSGILMVMNSDGTGQRAVTTGHTYDMYASPNWSPDGKWIVIRGPSTVELVSVADGSILPLSYAAGMGQPMYKP